jgi:4-amino-4-deoxy-L-arabinose transferase-like glycosyltransferase
VISTDSRRAAVSTAGLASVAALIMPIIAMALGFFAQSQLDKGTDLTLGVVAFAASGVLFAYCFREVNLERADTPTVLPGVSRLSIPALALSIVLGALAFVETSGNQFRAIGMAAWLCSILVYFYALPHVNDLSVAWARVRSAFALMGVLVRWEILILVAITAIGAFFRFYKLDAIPAEMGPDLPLKYMNVQNILDGNYMVFFPSHPGRESLFFYWAAIFARLFGNSHLTIKFAAALAGTCTIPALYLVVKRLFNAEAGLYAALLLAISHWHIILSRIGFRSILVPFFLFILIYLTLGAIERRRDFDFALAGLWLGLGLYTYNSWLLAPVALGLALLLFWSARRTLPLETAVRFLIVAGIAAFLVWMPLARYGYENPEMYLRRVATRITSEEQPLPPDVVGVFLDNLKRTFAMLSYRGDSVFVQNVPFLRELGFFSGVLFILGLAYLITHWRRGHSAILLAFFAIMLLPSALSIAFPQEVPNDVRSSGGIGMAILIAALPLPLIRKRLVELLPSIKLGPITTRVAISPREEWRVKGGLLLVTGWIVPAFALFLFWGEAQAAYNTYFVDYVNAQPSHNYSISRELARTLDDFAGDGLAFVKIYPYWYDGNALRVQLHRQPPDWHAELDHFDANQPPFSDLVGQAMFLVNPQDTEALRFLQEFFPQGLAVEHRDPTGDVQFIAFYGEK